MGRIRNRGMLFVGLCLTAVLMIAVDASAAGVDGDSTVAQKSMFDLIKKGGFVMWPIGLCSVLAIALAVERFISLGKWRMFPESFISNLQSAFKSGGKDAALTYCDDKGPIGAIFRNGVLWFGKGNERVEKALDDAGMREASKLRRSLKGLSLIATISPLLGLAGTVYGMISSFQSLGLESGPSAGRTASLVTGIYEALVTTAAGLTVAIPVLILYSVLAGKVDNVVDEVTELGDEFMLAFDADISAGA